MAAGIDAHEYRNGSDAEESLIAEDRVLVVLTEEASKALKPYTADDFSAVGCEVLTDLSSAAAARYKEAREKSGTLNGQEQDFHQIYCMKLSSQGREKVYEAIERLNKMEDILYAGPDYQMTVFSTTPNDLYYSYQWGPGKVSLPLAWDISTGASSVIIGVADSGIAASHTELSTNVNATLSRTFLSGSPVAVGTVTDANGHGTMMAGIIGAKGNNAAGIAGTAWNAQLVSLQVFDSSCNGYASYLAAAVNYAESAGIKLINFSGGWWSEDNSFDYAMYYAISNYSGLSCVLQEIHITLTIIRRFISG